MKNWKRVRYFLLLTFVLLAISRTALSQVVEGLDCIALSDKEQFIELQYLEREDTSANNEPGAVAHIDWSLDNNYLHVSYFLPAVSTLPWTLETIWDLETEEVVSEFDGPERLSGSIPSAALSVDFKYYAILLYEASVELGGTLKITNVETSSSIVFDVNNGLSFIRWSPDGAQIAVVSQQRILLLDAATGNEINSFDTHGRVIKGDIYWINEALRWASINSNNQISVWQSNTDTPILELPEEYNVDSVQLLPMGTRLVAATEIWDVESNESTTIENLPANRGIWSPNERCIAAGFVRTSSSGLRHYIGIWDVTQQALVSELEIPTSIETIQIAWSLDSQRIAIGENDGVLKIWGVSAN